jgi:CRISPR-associated protein Csx3
MMAKPIITTTDAADFRIVRFEIPGGVCTSEEFAEAVHQVEPALAGSKVVLLNGRGPVWGYGMLIHAAHPTPAVGTFDPRLGGYVVVASHNAAYAVGSVIPDPEQAQ